MKVIIEFNESEYKRSHGKCPKGRGRWIFATVRKPTAEEMVHTPSNLTYTQAKAYVKKVYKAIAKTLEASNGPSHFPYEVTFYTLP